MPSQPTLLEPAISHLRGILTEVFHHSADQEILIIYDEAKALTRLLTQAYRIAAPEAACIDFDRTPPVEILDRMNALAPGALVALIQSSSFRLDAFRIRLHLFERGLKVIEHPHLGRVNENEFETYISALAYDSAYYQGLGPALKQRLDRAREVRLTHGEHQLIYQGPFEAAMLNIGDYRHTKNIGGQFPIGEVFTELRDLTRLNGELALFAFGDRDFSVFHCADPILLEIENGRVAAVHSAPDAFHIILDEIRNHEGEVWLRELGFGLNRAMNRETRILNDVGTYERMCGIHLSLGGKHALYPKPGFSRKKMKYHVDVFAAVDRVSIDGETVYEDGVYTV